MPKVPTRRLSLSFRDPQQGSEVGLPYVELERYTMLINIERNEHLNFINVHEAELCDLLTEPLMRSRRVRKPQS